MLPRLDGILFSGGIDLQPHLYGEEVHPATDESDPRLDEFEMKVANWALQEDIPVLGVCRGMQLLNVVLGGTLYQDISALLPDSLQHCRRDQPRTALTHEVTLTSNSLMAKVLGTQQVAVNSLHHQAVKNPGKGVVVSGRAPDGIAEMLEVPGHRFVLGTQGHPEEVYEQTPVFANLFQEFVRACSNLPADAMVTQPYYAQISK